MHERAAAAARAAFDAKTKPRGSLGRLEELAIRIAGIRGTPDPGRLTPAIVVCAADSGVAAEGVSAYPQEVTAQMVRTFATGGAAVCVLAREAGARLVVADLGVIERVPGVVDLRVRAGTANAARGPAMTRAEAERAIAAGRRLAERALDDGANLIAVGEMGIGNTTVASALTAALLDADPETVCGRGTGLDDAGLRRKVATVRRMLTANELGGAMDTLAAVGGLEIAALVGVVLACAERRTPVLLDGFVTGAAALVAAAIEPSAAEAMVAAHRSPEPGHRLILEALELEPLLDLELRLGEGSGAALALPLVNASLALLSDMATFDAAGVTDAGA